MKGLITVTIDADSQNNLKSDTGMIYRAIADAMSKTNGSEIHIHSENADNTEAMHFLITRLIKWSGGSRPPGHRRNVKRKGWLANVISNAKDEVMAGLTS